MQEKKLFLLDAYALIFRAYYALIRAPRFTSQGLNTSTMFGFVNSLHEVITKENPTHMAVCFDPVGGTFRHEIYPEYKAGREATPEDIKRAVPWIKRIVEAYRIPIFEVPGFEADDVIGSLATQAAAQGFDTFMMTPDKDFGQLVTENIKMYSPVSGGIEVRGVKEICEKYSIKDTHQVIDLLALMGDKVDNVPGCPGVGEVTAIKLIKEFGSLENLLANTAQLKGALKKKVEDNVEGIRFSKMLVTIRTDAPVTFHEEDLRRQPMNTEALREIFKELEFKTLTARILGNATAPETPAEEPTQPAPKAEEKATSGQLSLFDFGDDNDEATPAEATAETIPEIPTERHYRIASSASELLNAVQNSTNLGVQLIADGDEAMRASVVGIAVSPRRGEALYLPVNEGNIAQLQPLFSADCKAQIACGDVKRDMVILRRLGMTYDARYFDIGVAHYLLQPERNHSIDRVAEEQLGVTCQSAEQVLKPAGKALTWAELPLETVCQAACEWADFAAALQPVLTKKLEQEGLTHLLNDVEQPLVDVLADMELAGARIDKKALNQYSLTLSSKVDVLEQECYELAGVQFNTGSPAQVGEILFERLKIDDKAKRTKSGKYSTTEDVLIKLRDRHPLIDKILELRGIRKLLSTYVNALPLLVNPVTGRIHSTFNQTVTATGRLSSTAPNMQNIPVRNDEGREIRRAFIPAEGNLFFSADYSQIELRLVADFSGDTTMIDAFNHGHDIHAITAAKIYHQPLDSVTSDQRRKAKTANFGILYGISAFGLSERLQIPRAESKALIEGYFNTFPGVKEYIERSVAEARKKGYVTTLLGRRRMLPDINSQNAIVRGFSERNAVNAPIQGSAADVIKIAMVAIHKRFKQEGLQSKMIMQVHDELNFDVVPAELDRVQAIVVAEMEGAYSGRVKLTASHAAASNWLDAH